MAFSTLDSQPQEWLANCDDALHTLCVCCFRDSASAKRWIHRLVPRDRNDRFTKWSHGRGARAHSLRRRQFTSDLTSSYDEWDFKIHCISSTESEISAFANMLYLQNLARIRQESDKKGRNTLVFRLDDEREVKIPVLRAAKLIWIYFALKYMRDVNGLTGFIYSDWFACDTVAGVDGPIGIGMVNLLLKGGDLGVQLSIPIDPARSEADLLSDWMAGWCNTSVSGNSEPELTAAFEELLERPGGKLDWVRYTCSVEVGQAPEEPPVNSRVDG